MSTTIEHKSPSLSIHRDKAENKQPSTFWKNAEFDRFGYIPILLILLGCIGGFAAALTLGGSMVALLCITITSCVALAMMLAGAPMKIILGSAALAILIDLIMIVTHF